MNRILNYNYNLVVSINLQLYTFGSIFMENNELNIYNYIFDLICGLFPNLRNLEIKGYKLDYIPISIKKLTKLNTLILENTTVGDDNSNSGKLNNLPKEIGKLIQ